MQKMTGKTICQSGVCRDQNAETGLPGHDRADRTAMKGRTGRTGQTKWDRQYSKARYLKRARQSGKAERVRRNWTGERERRKGPAGRIGRTGQAEQDRLKYERQNRTGRKGHCKRGPLISYYRSRFFLFARLANFTKYHIFTFSRDS